MKKYTTKLLIKIARQNNTIFRFMIVGAAGFLINATILSFLHKLLGYPLFLSQLIGAEVATISNFILHNKWTYSDAKKRPLLKKLWQFHASSWVGSLITVMMLLVLVNQFSVNYLIALVVGGGVAMIWNFAWSRFVIWRPSRALLIEEAE